MKRIKISDNIFLNVIRSDKFKTDYFDLNLLLPLREETASLAALLPQVLQRGCKRYPHMSDISKRLDYLYSTGISGRVFKRGETQVVSFAADFLRESLLPAGEHLIDDVFEAIKNIVFEPLVFDGAFKSDYVESEKKNLIDAINSIINNKNAYAMNKCHEIMCEGQNFSVCEKGKKEIVEGIDGKALYDFYQDLLACAKIEMFYTGMCDEDVIVNHASSLVADISRKNAFEIGTEKFERSSDKVKDVTEEMEVAQGKLVLCFRSGYTLADNNYSAYALFNNLYGGSPTSKLFENVREKLSLCYFCRPVPDAHKGILTVISGIEVANREKAQNEILVQLENVKNGDVSDEELESAKKDIINTYRSLYDSASDLSMWYLSRLIGGSQKTVDEVIDEISGITKEQIVECARSTELDTVYFLKGTLENGGEEE